MDAFWLEFHLSGVTMVQIMASWNLCECGFNRADNTFILRNSWDGRLRVVKFLKGIWKELSKPRCSASFCFGRSIGNL